MKKVTNMARFILLASFVVAASACADSEKDFEQATRQYCELYNPTTWGELANSGDTYSIYNAIITRQERQITSEILKAILSGADSSDFPTYYHSIQAGISKELGSDWQCRHFAQFYMPTQKVVSLTLGGVKEKRIDPNNENTIVITVIQGGQILLGSAPLVNNEPETIIAAIQSRVGKKTLGSIEFVLYFDENGKGDLAPNILSALSGLGVKQVSLIDF